MGVFDQINTALEDKPSTGGGPTKRTTDDSKPVPPNPNKDKMKALGLKSMPEDGQEGLDRLYAAYQSQNTSKKKNRLQTLYKDTN